MTLGGMAAPSSSAASRLPATPRPVGSVARVVPRPALALLALLLVLVPAPARVAEPETELIVRFRAGAEPVQRLEARQAAGVAFEERLPLTGSQVVSAEAEPVLEAVEAGSSAAERPPAEPNLLRGAFRRRRATPPGPTSGRWTTAARSSAAWRAPPTPTSTPRTRGR